MLLKLKILLLLIATIFLSNCGSTENGTANKPTDQGTSPVQTANTVTTKVNVQSDKFPIVGAERLDQYLSLLKGKTVGLVVNHTSTIGGAHLVDVLLDENILIKKIFAPEHGFRGKADAGELVADGKDARSGLPLISLYGQNKKPSVEMLSGLDILIFDIQDVGARFYTYISTMHYVMEACAENNKQFIVLDRPNPNGHYVDGPIRDDNHISFVGLDPLPIVHGMTVGELAQMMNGEGWLKNEVQCDLNVIPCLNYTHQTRYALPIKPSPNLPNMNAIYLYPSLCLFEGTDVSIGRGTNDQFQVIGHPDFGKEDLDFKGTKLVTFTPKTNEGSKHPKHEGEACNGIKFEEGFFARSDKTGRLHLEYLVAAYKVFPNKEKFFIPFFETLAGTDKLRKQIVAGKSASDIRDSWGAELREFKEKRQAYLIYK